MRRVLLIMLAAGCGAHRGSQDLGPLTFDVPMDWTRSDTQARGVTTAVFGPAVNTRKETITVTRTELVPNVAAADMTTIARYLEAAQRGLPGAKPASAVPLANDDLAGVRVDVDFKPPGATHSYHRIHAVFADHGALVHVIYTAVDPDPTAFDLVITSLHEES